MKISQLITTLQDIRQQHGDLTFAEEKPLGFFVIRHVVTKAVPRHFAVLGVAEGETVVLIRGQ